MKPPVKYKLPTADITQENPGQQCYHTSGRRPNMRSLHRAITKGVPAMRTTVDTTLHNRIIESLPLRLLSISTTNITYSIHIQSTYFIGNLHLKIWWVVKLLCYPCVRCKKLYHMIVEIIEIWGYINQMIMIRTCACMPAWLFREYREGNSKANHDHFHSSTWYLLKKTSRSLADANNSDSRDHNFFH